MLLNELGNICMTLSECKGNWTTDMFDTVKAKKIELLKYFGVEK
jgi:hypothetical protein